jgi:hypothetical protein
MARLTTLLLVLGCLALPAGASAKRRTVPLACPADVAAAVDAACPCDGKLLSDGSLGDWRSHGRYVSCVAHFRNRLRKAGCLTDDERRSVTSCAARSTCGSQTVIICCLTDPGACVIGADDASGTCAGDPSLACDVDEDCDVVHARLTRDDGTCDTLGGDTSDGSVCTACE